MRATTTPALHTRLRGVAAGTAAAALAFTLMPGDAVAQTADPIDVTVKIADQPAVEVASVPKIWPTTLLEAHGVPVDSNDLVTVRRDGKKVSGERKRLRHGDVVRLVAVEKKRVVKHKKVRAGVVEVPTTKLKPGVRKVVRTAKPGLRKVVAKRTFHNGTPVKYKVVKRKMVEKPRAKRVLVGRKPYSVPGADGLNWAALARCESGGNPRAVNPAGYYGLYQFDVSTWRSVGGSGLPTGASAGEQTYRAKLLYKQRGRSPWPTCGRLL